MNRVLNKIFDYLHQIKSSATIPDGCFLLEEPSHSIGQLLLDDSSASVVRIGGLEGQATYDLFEYGNISNALKDKLQVNAGFYGRNKNEYFRFAFENALALSNASVVAFWNSKNQLNLFKKIGIEKPLVALKSLEPFSVQHDWLSSVKTRVCVVSPFAESMHSQVRFLNQIHPDVNLSKIEFDFIKPPQTNAGYVDNITQPSWFERLQNLEDQIIALGNHIILVGAGSYGLPLAERLRIKGFSTVVCGGSLQLLFGIIGKRWEVREDYQLVINQHWIRPQEKERPIGFEKIENGCYW
jgi:hypothetical protein